MIARRQVIKAALASYAALRPERTKYAWLGHYHDDVARELLGGLAADVLVYG